MTCSRPLSEAPRTHAASAPASACMHGPAAAPLIGRVGRFVGACRRRRNLAALAHHAGPRRLAGVCGLVPGPQGCGAAVGRQSRLERQQGGLVGRQRGGRVRGAGSPLRHQQHGEQQRRRRRRPGCRGPSPPAAARRRLGISPACPGHAPPRSAQAGCDVPHGACCRSPGARGRGAAVRAPARGSTASTARGRHAAPTGGIRRRRTLPTCLDRFAPPLGLARIHRARWTRGSGGSGSQFARIVCEGLKFQIQTLSHPITR